jgi:hypothetical protein
MLFQVPWRAEIIAMVETLLQPVFFSLSNIAPSSIKLAICVNWSVQSIIA